MRPPDPAEVRQRTGPCHTEGCGHDKALHVEPISDGHCEASGCRCMGWDPMTVEEWDAVYAVERSEVHCQQCREVWPCAGWIRGGIDAWQHAATEVRR